MGPAPRPSPPHLGPRLPAVVLPLHGVVSSVASGVAWGSRGGGLFFSLSLSSLPSPRMSSTWQRVRVSVGTHPPPIPSPVAPAHTQPHTHTLLVDRLHVQPRAGPSPWVCRRTAPRGTEQVHEEGEGKLRRPRPPLLGSQDPMCDPGAGHGDIRAVISWQHDSNGGFLASLRMNFTVKNQRILFKCS